MPRVLLVESPGKIQDRALLRRVLADFDSTVELIVADDAETVRTLVKDPERPSLILLDVCLPNDSGWSLLRTLKTCDECRALPIVVFTEAASDEAVWRSYHFHANAFVGKSPDPDALAASVRSILRFFLRVAAHVPQQASRAAVTPWNRP